MQFLPEKERAKFLQRQFFRQCSNIEDYLRNDYDLIAVHANSIIFAVNQPLADTLGYTEEEMVGLNAWLLFDIQSAPVIQEKLARKSEDCYQAICRRKDGSRLLVELWAENLEVAGHPARAISARIIDAHYPPRKKK